MDLAKAFEKYALIESAPVTKVSYGDVSMKPCQFLNVAAISLFGKLQCIHLNNAKQM